MKILVQYETERLRRGIMHNNPHIPYKQLGFKDDEIPRSHDEIDFDDSTKKVVVKKRRRLSQLLSDSEKEELKKLSKEQLKEKIKALINNKKKALKISFGKRVKHPDIDIDFDIIDDVGES